jgi:hypothetical protein
MCDDITSCVDEARGFGYIDGMENGMRYVAHRHRRYHAGWLITLCWLLPVMVVVAAAAFLFTRKWLANSMLPTSMVQTDKPHPRPLLTSDQAAKIAKDETSPVWAEGVKSTDVPKLNPDDYAQEQAKNYVFSSPRRHRHGLHTHHSEKVAPSDQADDDNDNTDTTVTAPPASPDTDTGDQQVPSTSPVDPPPATDTK